MRNSKLSSSHRIVVIGGGTGSFTLLNGLKKYSKNLTALVSMADDGGSTGILRDELGVLPPGDVRQCLVALAQSPQMRELFNYRFEEGSFAGHSFGNLFLTALEKVTGSFPLAVDTASEILNISGRVLPASLENITLAVKFADGKIIKGQKNIELEGFRNQRPDIFLEPKAKLTQEGKQALNEADAIIFAPGSLYTSLAAVLMVDGIGATIAKSKAKKIYVCNLATTPGQTDNFKVHDFVDEIERFMHYKVKLDFVIYNKKRPAISALRRYAKAGEFPVDWNPKLLKNRHYQAIGGDFVSKKPWKPAYKKDLLQRTLIRHDSDKIAQKIIELL